MNSTNYYAGPGKLYFNSKGFQAQGENSTINASLDEKTSAVGAGQFGEMGETVDDQLIKISTTPFDDWSLLTTLFPTMLGVSTAALTGLLRVGARPHEAQRITSAGALTTAMPAQIWTPDGQLYNFVRSAITKPPEVKLGPGTPLFGQIELTCLGDPTKNPGDSDFLVSGNAITETAAPDPGGPMSLANFVRGKWTGAYGTGAGFGGDSGASLEAEDFWTIVPNVKYNTHTVQKVSRQMTLASANFMIKARLFGPTHSQLLAKLLSGGSGYLKGSTGGVDLVLSGPASKTITLKNCEVKGAGFEFGGSRLRTGEVGFIPLQVFTAGVPQPKLIFSA